MGDTAFPNYLTIGADGSVAGVFPGGVDIPVSVTAPLTPIAGRAVRFIEEDGDVAGYSQVYDIPGIGIFRGDAVQDPGAPDDRFARLDLQVRDGFADAAVLARARYGTTTRTLKLIDDLGRSDLLRMSVVASREIAFGTATLTWAPGAAVSNLLAVNHGMNVTPSFVLATVRAGGFGIGDAWAAATAFGALQFQLRANFAGAWAAGGTQLCDWIAIG